MKTSVYSNITLMVGDYQPSNKNIQRTAYRTLALLYSAIGCTYALLYGVYIQVYAKLTHACRLLRVYAYLYGTKSVQVYGVDRT